MHWELSEEQSAYAETLRSWLEEVAAPSTLRTWFDTGDPAGFEQRLVRDGMSGVGLPESLGGQGGDVVELALTAEELGRACAPSSAWLATVLAVPALPADLAARALHGEGVAWLVPSSSIPGGPEAVTVGGDGRLSGSVPLVLGADRVARFVVPAGDALHLVEAADVDIAPRALLDRSRSVADVRLDAVPSQPLDTDPGVTLARAADIAAVLLAADSLGATERMLDLAVSYSLQRRQFGRPIGSFQAVKHAAATILVGVEAARSAVYLAAAALAEGDAEASLHAAAMKAQVTAEGSRAADSALTIHGAIGYTWEHDLHLFYKRARLDEQMYGPPAAWNERLAAGLALT